MDPALDTTLGHSVDEFLTSLESAIKWCSWRLRTSSSPSLLRSPELHPWAFAESRKEMVGSVMSQRGTIAKAIVMDSSGVATHQADWLASQKKRPA